MGVLSNLIIKIAADTSGVDKGLSKAQRQLKSFASDMQSAGSAMTLAVTAPLGGVALAAVNAAGKMEQANIAFKTLLGGAERGARFLKDLQDFALKTPFEFEGLQDAAKRMLALGFAASDIVPTLRTVGDAVSALGGGKELIDRVTLALGQMKAKGTVQAEEMRQLAEAGIPAWELLAKTLGVSIPEAMKMVEKRMVESSVALPAILAGMNDRFAGMMEQQSQTLLGKWSNVKDRLFKTFSDIGTGLLPTATMMVDGLNDALVVASNLARKFAELPPSIQGMTITLGALAAGAGPTIWGIGALAGALSNISALLKGGGVLALLTRLNLALASIAAVAALTVVPIKKLIDDFRILRGEHAGMDQAAEELADRMRRTAIAKSEASAESIRLAASMAATKKAVEAAAAAKEKFSIVLRGIPFGEKSAEGRILVETYDQMRRKQDDLAESIVKLRQVAGKNIFDLPVPVVRPDFKAPSIGKDPAVEALDEQIRQRKALDRVALENTNQMEVWGKVTRKTKEEWHALGRQVSTILTDTSRSITDLIFKGGKFKDVIVGTLQEIGKAFTRFFIEQGIRLAITEMSKLLGLTGRLAGLFGGGGDAAKKVTDGLGNQAPKVGGSLGASAGGVLGAVGAVGSAVSAVSGVIGNFQMAGMNKTLDLIEKEVRFSQIHLSHILENTNEYLPWLLHIHTRWVEFLNEWRVAMRDGAGATIELKVNGRVLAETVARELKLAGV